MLIELFPLNMILGALCLTIIVLVAIVASAR